MKYLKIILITTLISILSACTGEEPDNIAYVTALGIDKQDNEYVYTIQIAQPTKISGGSSEEGGSIGDIVENISVNAPTIYTAISNANSILSKSLSLSHAKIIVISKNIAKEGLKEINDVFSRNNDIRPEIYYTITDNSQKYLESVKPSLELNPVKYYQLTYESNSSSSIPTTTAFNFYSCCQSNSKDCILPLSGVAEAKEEEDKSTENKSAKESEKQENGFEYKNNNYLAGQAGTKIRNTSETVGGAVFKGDKYITDIGSAETEIYNILTNDLNAINISFYTSEDSDYPITIKTEEKKPPKYVINKDLKTVDVYLTLEGELISVSEKHKNNNDEKETNKKCSQIIDDQAQILIKKLYNNYNLDVLGIRGKLKNKFLTNNTYNRYCQNFSPNEWNINTHTNFTIKRTGMTFYN